jgi:hypothetical protein
LGFDELQFPQAVNSVVDARLPGVADVVGENVTAVGPWDAPDLRTPVAAEVRAGGSIFEPGVAENTVYQEGRRECHVEADAGNHHANIRPPELPESGAGEFAERACSGDGSIHIGILAPDHQLRVNVVVGFDVALVARQAEGSGTEVVAGEAEGILSRLVGQRGGLLNLSPRRR